MGEAQARRASRRGPNVLSSPAAPATLALFSSRSSWLEATRSEFSTLSCTGNPRSLSAWRPSSFEFLRGDVRDSTSVATAVEGVNTVIHLAAVVGDPACERAPELAKQTNVEATSRLLDAASAAGVRRFVFLSTCSNYGKMADPNAYVTEDSELNPISLYAETKVAAEADVASRCTSTFQTCILRLATVYGVSPRMRFDLTINEFTRDLSSCEAVGRLRRAILASIHPRPRCRIGALHDCLCRLPGDRRAVVQHGFYR